MELARVQKEVEEKCHNEGEEEGKEDLIRIEKKWQEGRVEEEGRAMEGDEEQAARMRIQRVGMSTDNEEAEEEEEQWMAKEDQVGKVEENEEDG